MEQRQQMLVGVLLAAVATTCAIVWYAEARRKREEQDKDSAPAKAGDTATAVVGSGHLLEQMTIVITTSPVKSNPSTAMFEKLMAHFQFVPELHACRKIIMCDGCKIGGSFFCL